MNSYIQEIGNNIESGTLLLSFLAFILSVFTLYQSYMNSKKGRITEFISSNRVQWMQTLKKIIAEYFQTINKFDGISNELYKNYLQEIQEKTNLLKLHLNYLGDADKNILNEVSALNRIIELNIIQDDIIKNLDSDDEDLSVNAIKSLRALESRYIVTKGDALYVEEAQWKQLLDNIGDTQVNLKNIYFDELQGVNEILQFKPLLITIYAEVYLKTEWERVKYEIAESNHKKFNFNEKYNNNLKEIQEQITAISKFIINSKKLTI